MRPGANFIIPDSVMEMCVERILWFRRKGRVYVCGVGWGEDESVHGVVLPTLAPGLTWTVEDKVVCGVEGKVDMKRLKKLVGGVRVAVDDWPEHDWSRESPLVQAVCNHSWRSPDELMALLAPSADTRWGWSCVPKELRTGLAWTSARNDRVVEGYPTVGSWCYLPHWEPQITRAGELIQARGLIVRRAEPIYDSRNTLMETLVTPCPLTFAELQDDGFDPVLVAPGTSPPPGPTVLVGLEDATVEMLVTALEWLGDDVCVWHRWEPRDVVPWRGRMSPPMALEVVCATATRVEDGALLGEPGAVTMDPHRAKSFHRLALHTGLPTFVETRDHTFKNLIEVGDTVYDEARGVYGVVTRLSPGLAPNGRLRFPMTPKYGMVYGGGAMILDVQCGPVKFKILSSEVTYAGSQPRASLPRRGARLPLGVRVPGSREEGGSSSQAH